MLYFLSLCGFCLKSYCTNYLILFAGRHFGTLRPWIRRPPIILTIAGFDPSSGAGVTANIKTIATHGCYGVAAITALTVQSTLGVRRVRPSRRTCIAETLAEIPATWLCRGSYRHAGFGRGCRRCRRFPSSTDPPNVVLDPVLRSTSGAALLDDADLKC